MRSHQETVALFEIGSRRGDLVKLQVMLMNVAGDIAPLQGSPVAGRPDTDFRELREIERRLGNLDAAKVEGVAGPVAARALRGFHESFEGMHEAYGLACGPDRDLEGAENLMAVLRAIATDALGYLTMYIDGIKRLDVPSADAYVEAVREVRRLAKPLTPDVSGPTVPKVRLPFEGEVSAARARTALGYAFGGLSALFLHLRSGFTKDTGMTALSDLAGVSAYVGQKSHTLARRCAEDDRIFALHLGNVSDDLEILYRKVEDEVAAKDATPEGVGTLAGMVIDHAKRVAAVIRHVDMLAVERGYPMGRDEPSAPSM